MYDKIIVTNRERLLSKYGNDGSKTISMTLTVLADSDERRGIKSSIVYLDDSADMKKVRGKAVTDALDPLQNKKTIDSV